MRRTLVVTNDFPPRPGGIQTYVANLLAHLPADSVVVYASRWPGADEYDRRVAYPVIRQDTGMLLPTPAVARRARGIARAEGCTAVWFAAAAPLGLLADGLRRAGVDRLVASTHGHEIGWAALPVARRMLRRVADSVDAVTYLGEYTRVRLARAFGARAELLHRLPPGVDAAAFHPASSGEAVRGRYGLTGRPVVVCVSRLVARKGQDTLIRALPAIRRRVPDAALLIVGGGRADRLRRLAGFAGVAEHVVFAGSAGAGELPAYYAAGNVFAMPCRTRLAGLDVEGLGIVYLEASAMGLPVVAGLSGGAPEAVLDGRTGHLVDGRDVAAVADRVAGLLADPATAARLGRAGRDWVAAEWRWETFAGRLAALLAGPGTGPAS